MSTAGSQDFVLSYQYKGCLAAHPGSMVSVLMIDAAWLLISAFASTSAWPVLLLSSCEIWIVMHVWYHHHSHWPHILQLCNMQCLASMNVLLFCNSHVTSSTAYTCGQQLQVLHVRVHLGRCRSAYVPTWLASRMEDHFSASLVSATYCS